MQSQLGPHRDLPLSLRRGVKKKKTSSIVWRQVLFL